jgi:acyl-coenzyme A synthetase/AMP-(fatty) acid ligase
MTPSWIVWLQVAPAELEAHLLGHEQVADACVVQKNCDRAGELPKAYVVPKDAAAADKEKIRADVNAHVWGENHHIGAFANNTHLPTLSSMM